MTQDKFVETDIQLAEVLTKGSFAWFSCGRFVQLFNIMDNLSFSRRHLRQFPLNVDTTMSQRPGQAKDEEPRAKCGAHAPFSEVSDTS